MRPHRTDSVSLFFGLAFLMISLGYVANVYLDLSLPSMGWFIAAGLVFLGIVGAVTALVPTKQAAPLEQPADLPAEQPFEQPSEQTSEQISEQSSDLSSDQSFDRDREEDADAGQAR